MLTVGVALLKRGSLKLMPTNFGFAVLSEVKPTLYVSVKCIFKGMRAE